MKTLILMRHAKSSWKDSTLDDHDRPLNSRGWQDAPKAAAALLPLLTPPALALCSTARRATQTLSEVISTGGFQGATFFTRELYLADAATILDVLRAQGGKAKTILLIAHNPGLEELAQALTGEQVPFPTAGIARIDLSIRTWKTLNLPVNASLAWQWRPGEKA
jgi:phosphohistidine phosphatase